MTDEEFAIYRDGRYEKALEYYDDRAKRSKFGYRFCSIYVLVVSVAITPILTTNLISREIAVIIVALLAPTAAIAAGIAAHFQFHENWLSYRATWDTLKHELHWRDAQVYDYKDAQDRNAHFVERVEVTISQEGCDWLKRQPGKEYNTKGPVG